MPSPVTFFILDASLLDNLRELARQIPQTKVSWQSHPKKVEVEAERLHDANPYNNFLHFLEDNGTEPFVYEWSGRSMETCLIFLRHSGVDLTEFKFKTEDDSYIWLLFDKTVRDKYLEKLDLNSFSWVKIDKWLRENHKAALSVEIVDGITILKQYLDLVDDSSLVLLHTDFLPSTFLANPEKSAEKGVPQKKSFYFEITTFLCDECGDSRERSRMPGKRIADPAPESSNFCGYEVELDNTSGREITHERRTEKHCKRIATRRYVVRMA